MNIENYISSGIIEQYVLGMCNKEEKTEVESLREQYASVNDAVINFETSLESNLMASVTATTLKTDDAILNELKQLNNAEKSTAKTTTGIVRSFSIKKYFAAASIGLLLASAAYNYYLYNENIEQSEKMAAFIKNNSATLPLGDYKVLTDPNITPVSMYGVPAHAICKCTLYWDKNTGKAYIMIHHLMATDSGKAYQLWATVDGKPVSLGTIDDKIRGRFVEVNNVPFESEGFTVSQEINGNAKQPTPGQEWLVGKI